VLWSWLFAGLAARCRGNEFQMILRGRCISPGVAAGRAQIVDGGAWLVSSLAVASHFSPVVETERLHSATDQAIADLGRIRGQLVRQGRGQDAEIFTAHATMLTDPKFTARIVGRIREDHLSAEAAVAQVVRELKQTFLSSDLPAIQDKVPDILDIGRRLVHCLNETAESESVSGGIVVAVSVTPSELVRYAHQRVAAIVTETCGAKSHTAILARGLGVPLVTGLAGVVSRVPHGIEMVVDASSGEVIFEPSESEQVAVQRIRSAISEAIRTTDDVSPIATRDHAIVDLFLNISDPLEAASVRQIGAGGVGLYRTEFFYMDRAWWPSEDVNYDAYLAVSNAVREGELQIRLADFGAEKSPPYADIPMNRNPSLGVRGVRLLLQRDDILRPQVRALARLGEQRPLTVLLPMIDTLDTLQAMLARLCGCCGVSEPRELPFRVSAMIEVPAAALMIDEVIEQVDAVSVGLNDLTQYLLAADRDDESTESYHDPLQPAVLRTVRRIVQAAEKHGKPVTMCGEMAGDTRLATALLSIGVRRFSVSRSHFREIAQAVRSSSLHDLQSLREDLLAHSTGAALRGFLRQHADVFGMAGR